MILGCARSLPKTARNFCANESVASCAAGWLSEAAKVLARCTVPGRPSARQLDLTYRLLERSWLVLLLVSLGFALYGNDAGIFHSGT